MKYRFPRGVRLWCFKCHDVRPFEAAGTEVRGIDCAHTMPAAQVVATYATDDYARPGIVYFPDHALPTYLAVERAVDSVVMGELRTVYDYAPQRLSALDRAILRGEVDLIDIEREVVA